MSPAKIVEPSEPPPGATPGLRLALMLLGFGGLSFVGVWWSAPDLATLRAAWRHFAALPGSLHLLLGALAVGLIFAEMLRFFVVGRALGVRVGFWAALDACIANNFFSWLSPGAALGEPAAVYMLGRNGVPWDAALLITFGKFATSFVFIFGVTGVLLALGLGPPLPPWVLVPCAVATFFSAVIMFALLAGAYWPEVTAALIGRAIGGLRRAPLLRRPLGQRVLDHTADVARHAVQRLSGFRQGGGAGSAAIVLGHVLYYAAFVGVLVILAVGFDTPSVRKIIPIAIIYQGFLYVAPTPGGAGVGEAGAGLFFGSLLPGGKALVVVMLFRALTFQLQVLLGLMYLPLIGGMREILRGGALRRAAAATQAK